MAWRTRLRHAAAPLEHPLGGEVSFRGRDAGSEDAAERVAVPFEDGGTARREAPWEERVRVGVKGWSLYPQP